MIRDALPTLMRPARKMIVPRRSPKVVRAIVSRGPGRTPQRVPHALVHLAQQRARKRVAPALRALDMY